MLNRRVQQQLKTVLTISIIFFNLCIPIAKAQNQSSSQPEKPQLNSFDDQSSLKVHPFFYFHPLTFYPRYEKNEEQNYSVLNLQNFGAGIDFQKWMLQFEFSRFSTQSSSGNLKIDRSQEEYFFWGHFLFAHLWSTQLHYGLGLGSYNEKIKTTIAGTSKSDSSDMNWLGGGSLMISKVLLSHIFLSAEVRLIGGKDFDPQPQWAAALKFALYF